MDPRKESGGMGFLTVGTLRCPLPKLARRMGVAAIVFFVVKGLAWLALPAMLMWWRG
jgi:hypothetical protein